jgi:ABC-2 type transport system permease protein
MKFQRTFAIALRHFYLMRGSFSRVLPLFVWVAIDIILWGFITRYLNKVTGSGLDFVPQLLGAVLLWDFFIRILQGVTMAFLEDVWSRNFLNVFASPLTIAEYLGGLVISTIVTSAVGIAVMLFLACAVFGLSFAAYGAMLAPYLLTLFMFGIAIGILGCAVVLRFGPSSEWFVWPIPAMIAPFAGVFYPVSVLPGWMQWLSCLVPPSYVFENMRAIVAGHPAPEINLLWGVLSSVIYILLSCLLFERVYRYALRTGLIARYSAETLS